MPCTNNFIDRISRYYTVMFLLFCNIFVVTEDYYGWPIACWCPEEFTEDEVEYTNNVCWIGNTYHLPFQKTIPANYEVRRNESDEIAYYQWVPLFLFLMAALNYLPRALWRINVLSSGLEVKKMSILAKHTMTAAFDERNKWLNIISDAIDTWCANINTYRGGILAPLRETCATIFPFGCGRHYGNYYISLQIFVRFLYFLNAFGQLFLLNEFLGNKFYVFGYEIISSFLKGEDFTISPRFPRVVLCDFNLRQLTNVHRWTLQCVLPINVFNEKFFLFLWFWYVLLSILSLYNLLKTLASVLYPRHNESFVKKYLKLNKVPMKGRRQRHLIMQFINVHLQYDGVFVLKQLSDNGGSVVMQHIVERLWTKFLDRMDIDQNKTLLNDYDNHSSYSESSMHSVPKTGSLKCQAEPEEECIWVKRTDL